MKTILVDTNVILDVLAAREPHAHAGREVWIAIEKGLVRRLVAAHAVTTIEYLMNGGVAEQGYGARWRRYSPSSGWRWWVGPWSWGWPTSRMQ